VGALGQGYWVSVVADACGSTTALSDSMTFGRLRELGVTVTGGNQVLTEVFTGFGTQEGQKAMTTNLEEIVAKQAK
jgi:hypothetical protein